MAKFSSPLATPPKITQTYHTQLGNTAVDISANAEADVLAIADGTIAFTSAKGGSYCTQSITGSNIPKIYYVHTYKWLPVGTKVKKGQVIAKIAPKSKNGGYPTHIHLALPTGYWIMDYMDRSLPFFATHPEILKAWFINNKLNWNLFRDLSYSKTQNMEYTATTKLRAGNGIKYDVIDIIYPYTVLQVIGGPRKADGYTWYDLKDKSGNTGWAIQGAWTEKPVNDLDDNDPANQPVLPPVAPTPPVDPCEDKLKPLQDKIAELERVNKNYEKVVNDKNLKLGELRVELEKLQKESEEVSGLATRIKNLFSRSE